MNDEGKGNDCGRGESDIVVGLVMDFFNPGVLEGAKSYFLEHGIRLDGRWSVRSDWLPDGIRWDGVIHGIIDDDASLKRVKALSLPAVSLVAGAEPYCVVPDFHQAGKMAVEELIKYGCKQLHLLQVGSNDIDRQFFEGAIEEVTLRCVKYSEKLHEEDSFDQFVNGVVSTLIDLPRPVGLCLPHAGAAYSIVNRLMEVNMRIPEDVAIVVVDKDAQETSSMAACPITGVKLNEWYRGYVAAEMVHDLIVEKKRGERVVSISPVGIQRRESTGYIQKHDLSITKALSYLRSYYRDGIDVADVVTASGIARRTLEMRFKKILNSTIYEELSKVRIESAKQLLRESQATITEVAQQCGFSSLHYFSKSFKKTVGISPKEYREKEAPSASS